MWKCTKKCFLIRILQIVIVFYGRNTNFGVLFGFYPVPCNRRIKKVRLDFVLLLDLSNLSGKFKKAIVLKLTNVVYCFLLGKWIFMNTYVYVNRKSGNNRQLILNMYKLEKEIAFIRIFFLKSDYSKLQTFHGNT